MSLHKKTTKVGRTIQDGPENDIQDARSAKHVTKHPTQKTGGCRSLMMRWLVRLFLLVVVLIVVVPFGLYVTQPKYFKVLIIGSDQRGTEHARSDVLMIVAIPKSSKNTFSMTMIPRDTKIDHPEKGLQKITHFYAMWEDTDEYLGNQKLTQEVVEDVLGVNVDGTVEVTFDSFTEIVDLLGGVDTSNGHLDGAEAQEVVHNRYNKAGGDFGRGVAQREILRNLLSRMKTPTNAQAVRDYFAKTDRARLHISLRKAAMFGAAYVIGHRGDLSLGEVEEVVIPGAGQRIYTPDFGKELYYWVLDEAGTKETVETYLQ